MTGDGSPRISIGLPVYNGERTLARALDSVLAQDMPDFEVVISDNASTDRTAEICERYAAADARIRYHRNETNVGLIRNFNLAFELSTGEYFKWHTHDDQIDPRFLSACSAALDRCPGSVLCAPSVVIVDGDGRITGRWHPVADLETPDPSIRLHRLLWSLGETHAFFGLMRSSALRRTNMFQPFLGGDRVLLAELVLLGGIHQLEDELHRYTVDDDARRGRRYSTYNDPKARLRVPMRTWRLWGEHLRVVMGSSLPAREKAILLADVSARFAGRDARRLAAEAYHAAVELSRSRSGIAAVALGFAVLAVAGSWQRA
jgi:glycosyltransferase involved in cell wall biosynthesis